MKISVCGCGWLGTPLAERLKRDGMNVWGSRRTEDGCAELSRKGITPVRLSLPGEPASLSDFLNTDVLVINVPPGRQEGAVPAFVNNISALLQQAQQSGCQRVLFISTTGVYGNVSGQVTESTPVQPDTASGHAHVQLEEKLFTEWGSRAVVLRPAGLIGPNRHPVKFLAGREAIVNGGDPVNLIHLDDVIEAICLIIKTWPGGEVLHLAAPQHPTREAYYCQMAERAGLPVPHFQPWEDRQAKWIDASATCAKLGLTIEHADLMAMTPEL